MVGPLTFSVGELNNYVKKLLEYERSLKSMKVRGEISNLTKARSGHIYFTLKDEDAAIRCIYFNGADKINPAIKEGDSIIVKGSITLYVKGGDYQLVVNSIEYAGIGYWYEKFHAIKLKLEKEGLFDESYKKTLPSYPRKIGVVTSETGAAIKDIYHVISEKYPLADILLYPVLVQGEYAAKSIADAIDYISDNDVCDVLIVGRGGGSSEDLWQFNQEIVARAIFRCKIPVVSAVGHERDFAISDFVADVREATPSSAASRVVPDINMILDNIYSYEARLSDNLDDKVNNYSQFVDSLLLRLSNKKPSREINEFQSRLDILGIRIKSVINNKMNQLEALEIATGNILTSLSPMAPLVRGYMMAIDENNTIIHSSKELREKGKATLVAHDGEVKIRIDKE